MKAVLSNQQRPLGILIHVIVWMLIFLFPILISGAKSFSAIDWKMYLQQIQMPIMCFMAFYLNFSYLVPRFLLKKQNGKYILFNLVLIVLFISYVHVVIPAQRNTAKSIHSRKAMIENVDKERSGASKEKSDRRAEFRKKRRFMPPPRWTFMLGDAILLLCIVGLGTGIRMSKEWDKAETALQEAEKNRMEAELSNLRNQLNPHFLLNTLNNIYALIAFDSEKAQQAVHELSKLLRYMLYDNQQTFVPLSREIEFINNYIELMKIRLAKEVKVGIQIAVPENSTAQIAPLLFISLIENAFKHGVSSQEPSFINISIAQQGQQEVCCEIANSNHPKSHSDKSGSGIGLEQVSKRLELLYPGHYTWEKGISPDGKVYTSRLTLQTASANH